MKWKDAVVNWSKKRIKTGLIKGVGFCAILKTRPDNHVSEYPTTIQLPITYKCNFDCKMCGMHHQIGKKDFTAKELSAILSDKLFSKVEAVGINGGEPFLKNDLMECFHVMIQKLPNLKNIYIISNGFFTEKIVSTLKEMKEITKGTNIKLNVSFSVDGVGEMQDYMRGQKNAWINVNRTIDRIREQKDIYCDYLNVICTITKYNIFNINEVEVWSEQKQIDVSYNIATENVRIENEDRVENFTVLNDEEARMLTQEFFYKKFLQTQNRKYFALYLYMKENVRYANCTAQHCDWVTLTPNGQIGYCATYSKNLGSAKDMSAYDIFNSNKEYLQEIKDRHCKHCSHYIVDLDKTGKKLYYRELLRILPYIKFRR